MRKLLARIDGWSDYHTVAVPDTECQRRYLARAFEDDVEKRAHEIMKLADAVEAKHRHITRIPPDKFAPLHAELQDLAPWPSSTPPASASPCSAPALPSRTSLTTCSPCPAASKQGQRGVTPPIRSHITA